MKHVLFALTLISLLGACAHRSVLPEAKEVRVSRDEPGDDCKEIGTLRATTATAKGTREEALANLKQEAANKGINYIVIKQYSGYGTGVTGVGYECP